MSRVGQFLRAACAVAPLILFVGTPLAQPPVSPGHGLLQAGLEGEELAKDKTYAAGTRIKSARLGLSLKIPAGVTASFSPGGNALLLKGADRVGVLILRSGLSTDDIKDMFTAEMDLTSLHDSAWAERSAAPAVDGNKVSATYEGDEIYGSALGVVGEKAQGWAVVVMAGSAATASAMSKSVQDSVVWASPENEKELSHWRSQVSGQRLKVSAGAESVVVEIKQDGAYSLVYSNGQQEQKEAGKWRVEIGPLFGFLLLTPTGGATKTLYMMPDGKNLIVDGNSYTRTPLEGSKPVEGGETGKLERPAEADDKAKVRAIKEDPNWKSDQKELEKLEGDELQFNNIYAGDKRIKTDFLGVSFKTPAATKGGCDGKTAAFVMRPDDQRGLGILMIQTGLTSASGAAFLHDDLDLGDMEKGLVLKPSGECKVEGGKLTQDFTHETYTARAVMLIGPSGNALAVTFVGAKEDREKLHGYVDAIIKSVQFAKPQAEVKREELRKQLFGKCLHVYRYKQAGSGANSSSWETKIHWHFGSDGTYYYSYQFSGDHYVKGKDGSGNETHTGGAWSDNNRQENGKWRIEFNLTGVALVLTNEAGSEGTHQIRVADGKVYLNGEEVSVFNSDKKR